MFERAISPSPFFFPSFQSPLVIMGVKNNIWWLFLLSLSGYGAWARMESSLSSGHSPTLPHTGGIRLMVWRNSSALRGRAEVCWGASIGPELLCSSPRADRSCVCKDVAKLSRPDSNPAICSALGVMRVLCGE